MQMQLCPAWGISVEVVCVRGVAWRGVACLRAVQNSQAMTSGQCDPDDQISFVIQVAG